LAIVFLEFRNSLSKRGTFRPNAFPLFEFALEFLDPLRPLSGGIGENLVLGFEFCDSSLGSTKQNRGDLMLAPSILEGIFSRCFLSFKYVVQDGAREKSLYSPPPMSHISRTLAYPGFVLGGQRHLDHRCNVTDLFERVVLTVLLTKPAEARRATCTHLR
jgi:hypothetical protein